MQGLSLRLEEISASLCGNVENEFIDTIHVIGERQEGLSDHGEIVQTSFMSFQDSGLRPPSCLRSKKVRLLLSLYRPTYAQLINYASYSLPRGSIVVRRNPLWFCRLCLARAHPPRFRRAEARPACRQT